MFFFVMKRRHTTSQRKATLVPDTTLFRSDPAPGDNVLASIDDLVHTAISGHAPVGGTSKGLTVTDGTTTVTVDPATITVNPDGGFSTTADLSGLKEGSLTVKLQVEDADGNPATVTEDRKSTRLNSSH